MKCSFKDQKLGILDEKIGREIIENRCCRRSFYAINDSIFKLKMVIDSSVALLLKNHISFSFIPKYCFSVLF